MVLSRDIRLNIARPCIRRRLRSIALLLQLTLQLLLRLWWSSRQGIKLWHRPILKTGRNVGSSLQVLQPGQGINLVLALDQNSTITGSDPDHVGSLLVVGCYLTFRQLETYVADMESGYILHIDSVQS